MSSTRAWVIYSVLRIGLFIGIFAVLAAVGVNPFIAALIAAVAGLCVTYIFFRRQRESVVTSFAQWRSSGRGARDADGEEEDRLLDGTASARHPDAAASPESDASLPPRRTESDAPLPPRRPE